MLPVVQKIPSVKGLSALLLSPFKTRGHSDMGMETGSCTMKMQGLESVLVLVCKSVSCGPGWLSHYRGKDGFEFSILMLPPKEPG